MNIWKANPKIVEKIGEAGALFHSEKYDHSYMHCWRHKTPIIYRATTQWFVAWTRCRDAREKPTLREIALAAVDATRFYPEWARRAVGMIENRPDWCCFTPAQLGVPIAFFLHRKGGAAPETLDLLEQWPNASSRKASRPGSGSIRELLAQRPRNTRNPPTPWTSGSTPAPPTHRPAQARGAEVSGRPVLEARTAPRWFHSSCWCRARSRPRAL